jgi:hypothetical protein
MTWESGWQINSTRTVTMMKFFLIAFLIFLLTLGYAGLDSSVEGKAMQRQTGEMTTIACQRDMPTKSSPSHRWTNIWHTRIPHGHPPVKSFRSIDRNSFGVVYAM